MSKNSLARRAAEVATFERPKRTPEKAGALKSKSFTPLPATKPKRETKSGPTPERIAKGDLVRNNRGEMVAEDGLDRLQRTWRDPNSDKDKTKAEDVLKRLHHRATLSQDPGMNERMYQAGKRYEELVHLAGLSGIAAQNLLSAGAGSGHPAYSMPATEAIRGYRLKLRQAWDILPDEAVKALHGMLVDGRDAVSLGKEISSYKAATECKVAAMTSLRIALAMLVAARWA